MKFEEMDATTPLAKQLQDPYGGSVVLINKFTVALEDRDALVAAWADDAAYFKQQPGCISAQLHRGIGESPVFLNYAVWESVEAFRTAFGRPEFRSRLARVQPANNFLAIHRASLARCGPSTSDPATAPSNSTTRARAVAFGSFTPAAVVHSRKRSANHSR